MTLRTGRLQLTMESRMENLSLLGSAIRGTACAAGLYDILAFQLELCVMEAVTNVIRHAYGGLPSHLVDVTVVVAADRISYQVTDTGKSHPHFEEPGQVFDWLTLEQAREGGMGLAIIREVMDVVEYHSENGRNLLTMTKFLPTVNS